jgi:hypothetical protein
VHHRLGDAGRDCDVRRDRRTSCSSITSRCAKVVQGEILPLLNPNAPAWRLLFIGDSITTGTGYVDETYTSVLARGSADAYPFALADELRAADIDVGVEVVAYPGCTLVDRAPEVEGGGLGMISKFWSVRHDRWPTAPC